MADITVGRIVKAFGIKGELKFHPAADFWEEVLDSKQLYMRVETEAGQATQPVRVKRWRPHKTSYVLFLEGVTDRNTAETLVGSDVIIDEADLDIDLPDQLMPFQVLGCTAKTEDGEVLGEVTTVIHSAAHDVYEIENDERSFMVPAVDDFIVDYDGDKRELTIRPLPGLLDD